MTSRGDYGGPENDAEAEAWAKRRRVETNHERPPDTQRDHAIPESVGESPKTIPSAPDWANTLFAEMQDWQRSNRESIHELRGSLQVISANQDLMRHEIEALSDEMRARANAQEREQLRSKRRLEMLATATWGPGMRPEGWHDA